MRVLFRCDASPEIGGGHVMRCLTLAQELMQRGAECSFACSSETPAVIPQLENSPYRIVTLKEPLHPEELIATSGSHDAMVIDHYALGAEYERAARSIARRIMVIDDLADRAHDCDLLLDQTYGRKAAEYSGLVPPDAKVLTGTRYALLRPEFAQARPAALIRRATGNQVKHVFVSLGMTDLGSFTFGTVQAVRRALPDADITVALGHAAPSLARVQAMAREDAGLSVFVDHDDVCSLMTRADLAVGAAGGSAWERCCLGLPTVMLVLADNQRLIASNLSNAGAAIRCGHTPEEIEAAVRQLASNREEMADMMMAAAAVCDGHGAKLAAHQLLGSGSAPVVRPARAEDALLAWCWRNDPMTRAASLNTAAIPWDDHVRWWNEKSAQKDCLILIAELDGTPSGIVRFDQMVDITQWRVSIALNPLARGHGLGGGILAAAIACFSAQHPNAALIAEIRQDNLASRRVFEHNGFAADHSAGDVSRYRKVTG